MPRLSLALALAVAALAVAAALAAVPFQAYDHAEFWRAGAQQRLRATAQRRINTNSAKNLIMFLGDGMSIPTLAAARVYQGQQSGRSGEESQLFFETFPFAGLSKTYCVDQQVADSACSATAYLCGVKANVGTLGVTAAVLRGNCEAQQNASTHVTSLLHWGQDAGKATGIVTTTRVTHASPAGAYAHVANRDWESDGDVSGDVSKCPDIAQQLVTGDTGKNFKVILGGGRREFRDRGLPDEEGQSNRRRDGQDLVAVWTADKEARNVTHQFVWNREDLFKVDFSSNEYLLGLFEGSHLLYHLDAIASEELIKKEPSLADLVEAAIKTLQKEENGFVLFVEGGRIDHGHHDALAKRALDEAVQMAEAARAAAALTRQEDTLIVVTADHAHTLAISGYPDRGNDILGFADLASDNIAYPTLSYANGPGYRAEENGRRHDYSKDDTTHNDYKFPGLFPLSSETHGGDDVAVLSRGPWAHLLSGVFEQNYIPHVMAYAACVGDGATACSDRARQH